MTAIPTDRQELAPHLPEADSAAWKEGEAAARRLLSAVPAAIYTCDAAGRVTFYNETAVEMWGRRPRLGHDLWCGSWKIFTLDGDPLPLDRCPMAVALKEGRSIRGEEIIVERPDGVRRRIRPHPEPIRDASGAVVGAVNMLIDVTEQRQLEEAQARLAAIVECSDDAIVSKTLDGRITSWNSGAERIFGYTPEEVVGRSITLLIPNDRLTEEQTILQHIRRGERVEHYETVRVAKDGRQLDISVTVSPVRDGTGTIIGASKVARDITQRKAAQEALRRSERDLSDFFETATIGMHWVSPEGVILRANRAELDMLGYSAEDYVGRHITEFHADEATITEILARLHRGEDFVDFPARLRRKDGSLRHVLINSSVRREEGRFVHTRCFTRDVTPEVQAKAALQESEERLRALLTLLPVGVYACDAEGKITYFNRRAAALWGREPALNDQHERFCAAFGAYLPDGTPMPPDAGAMAIATREGKPFRDFEAIFESPDGRRLHVSVNVDPVFDADGRVTGAINVFQDITEQVRAREALHSQQVALEQAVQQRTRELEESHRRLRLSERMASLGTLSAGLGHDLGNLLLPVRVSLDALSSAQLPEASRADLDRIRTSAEYLQQLASGLRMLALDPQRTGNPDPTDLRDWWNEAHAIVRNALPAGIDLEADLPEHCPLLMSRPALTQAVFNLVQNAGDALRPQGRGHVRISARRERDRVHLTVADDGPGMSAEVRDHCMEPFFTTKTRAISTGLGLVLVAGLVRDVGGAVHLQTAPGEGAAFTLDLPAAAAPAAMPTRSRRLALVDVSDPRLRALVTSELGDLALEVIAGADERTIDLAVLDYPPNGDAARHYLLLGIDGEHPPHVTSIGQKPRAGALRRALRSALQHLDTAEAPAP
jgi:PAS domain S-box-containing protein